MDRLLTLLVFGLVFLGGGLVYDRLPPVDWRGPIPIVGPHIRFESLKARGDRLEAALKARGQRVELRQAVAAGITADVAQALAAEKVRVRTATQTLIEKVPIYVTPEADRRCVVPVGFVGLHDAAARGEAGVPETAGGPVDAASGLELSAVGETVTANYGLCHEWRAEANAWRDWYGRQAAAWARP